MKQTDEGSTAKVSSRNGLLWILLIILGGLTYLLSYRFAPTLETRNSTLTECPQNIYSYLQYNCGPFDIKKNPVLAMQIDKVDPSNQFIVLEAFPILASHTSSLNLIFDIEVSGFAVDKNKNIKKVVAQKENKRVRFAGGDKNQKDYFPESISEVTNIQDENYIFVLKFLNTEQMQEKRVEEFRLGFVTFNPTFEKHLKYFKYFLFAVALITWALYRNNISKLPKGFISKEQNYISAMGFILILFDQPFTNYSMLHAYPKLTWAIVLVTAAQASVLILFWFSLLERLASSTNTLSRTAKWIIGIAAILHFTLLSVAYGILVSDQSKNPLLDFQHDPSLTVVLCRYYLYGVIGIGAIWTLVRVCQIIPNFKNLDWRDSTALTFSFYYVLCYVFFTVTGSLQVLAVKGTRAVLLYGITTLYTVLLQIMYASFSKEIEEAEKRKKYDNPDVHGQYDDLNMSDISSSKDKKNSKGTIEMENRDAKGQASAGEGTEDDEEIEV